MAPVTSFAAGFVIAVSLSFVRSQTTTIASNTRDSTPGQSIGVVGGTTDVNSGVTYWLSGVSPSAPYFFLANRHDPNRVARITYRVVLITTGMSSYLRRMLVLLTQAW